MQQLESRHKSELANHFRAQEKELEQLRITYDREFERLRSKHKAELEQRVSRFLCDHQAMPVLVCGQVMCPKYIYLLCFCSSVTTFP